MIGSKRCLALCLGALIWAAGCGGEDDEDSIESSTERLTPSATPCVRSDTCAYGHCSTEDGVCNTAPSCSPGASCPPTCYGVCVTTPRKEEP
jgi:hypothetical protein